MYHAILDVNISVIDDDMLVVDWAWHQEILLLLLVYHHLLDVLLDIFILALLHLEILSRLLLDVFVNEVVIQVEFFLLVLAQLECLVLLLVVVLAGQLLGAEILWTIRKIVRIVFIIA